MLVGAGIFAEAYTFLKDNLLRWGDLGKLTIPKVIGINHWVIIAILSGAHDTGFHRIREKEGLKVFKYVLGSKMG